MTRVMVLGATGFIGGQIARAASETGWEVHALRRTQNAVGAVGDLPLRWHTGDLSAPGTLAAALAAVGGCDVLFHAAGYVPANRDYDVPRAVREAAIRMRGVLEAARQGGVGRVVYTSSLTTIGTPPAGSGRIADERDGYLPGSTRNPYYEAKWAMEHEALRANQDGLPVVTLCPAAVFGPEDVKPSTSELLLLLAKGRLPAGVDVVTNIVDGRDVALAHLRAAERAPGGERYIVGGHNLNVGEALRDAARLIGVRPPSVLRKATVAGLLDVAQALRLPVPPTMRGLPYWQPLNGSKARAAFDLTPRPFEETVLDTVGWFREHGYL